MTLRLNGSTSGYVELDAPATGDSSVATLPSGGNGTLGRLQLATAQPSTSGTSIDFTGIPSWVKRITVMFNGVSGSGTSPFIVQLGTSSGVASSGYLSHSGFIQSAAVGSNTANTGFIIVSGAGGDLLYGPLTVSTSGADTWLASGTQFRDSGTDYSIISSGFVALSGTLDRIRVTTVNGTDTFDAGSINILYEG